MSNFKEKGIAFIKAAVEEENSGNYNDAFEHYTDGIQCLMKHVKIETSQLVKDRIVAKIKEYLERAELLKGLMERQDGNHMASTSNGIQQDVPVVAMASAPSLLSPRTSCTKHDLRDMGISFVTEAVQADAKGQYEDAFELYKSACDSLGQYLKQEDSPRVRKVLTSKLKEYLDRAEYLKGIVEQRTQYKALMGKSMTRMPSNGADPGKSLLDLVMVQVKPTVRFSDLVNQQAVKDALQDLVVKPLTSQSTGDAAPRNVLLYGPSGVGKTQLLKAVASESGCKFFSVSSWFLTSKSLGADCESLIQQIFQLVTQNAPAILFFDDVDAFSSDQARSGISNQVTERVISRLQEVRAAGLCVSVLAATSEPYFLDNGMLSCFETRLYAPLPDSPSRQTFLRICLGSTPHSLTEEDFQMLAERTEGFAFADCKVAAGEAIMRPVRLTKESSHFREVPIPGGDGGVCYIPCGPEEAGAFESSVMQLVEDGKKDLIRPPPVTVEDFNVVLRNQRPTVGPKELDVFQRFTQEVCVGQGSPRDSQGESQGES